MPTHTQLHGVSNLGQPLLSEQLESNLLSFFQWGMLGIGNFFNITISSSGAYDSNLSALRLCDDRNYTKGQVWEAYRSDWVWESGIEYDYQPIRVSGVYVNGNFYSINETGQYKHVVNYPLGRIIFDNAISTTATVKCEYSHRYVHFTHSNVPWWRQIQQNSLRADSEQFNLYGSGDWSIFSQSRVQLPAVVIEALPDTNKRPFEIGALTSITRQSVNFHILAETPWDRQKLHDIITYQWQKRINAFDQEQVVNSSGYPLDENGAPLSGSRMYPDLINQYPWKQLRIMTVQGQTNLENRAPLYTCTVKCGVELDI